MCDCFWYCVGEAGGGGLDWMIRRKARIVVVFFVAIRVSYSFFFSFWQNGRVGYLSGWLID